MRQRINEEQEVLGFWEAYTVSKRKSFTADGEGDLVGEGEEGRHVIGFAGEESRNGVTVVVIEGG